MTASHTDPLPGEIDITDYNNVGLVEEIRRVVGLTTNSLINMHIGMKVVKMMLGELEHELFRLQDYFIPDIMVI